MPSEFRAEQYIEDVLAGRQVACKWVRLACERHQRDLATGGERGLRFDETTAKMAISFFKLLKHSKGEWAGRPLVLEGWQQFVVWSLFGWKRADGTRRFRTSYLEVARKNGKTTMAAGVGLYLMLADGEPGAEIYSVATKRDQARISHSEATRMAKSSPPVRKLVTVFKDNIHILDTASKFEPLGADSDTMDGLNVHGAVVDEVHAHKTRDTWDVIETATGARRQPLMFAITTAGYDRNSLCFQQHEYTEKILEGILQDDSWFGVIYCLDKVPGKDGNPVDEDCFDERLWVKANPNLGVSKKFDDMQRKALRAKQMPSALNAFLRLELDVWTQAETKWISLEHWNQCGQAVDADGLRGRTCYAGLDLSSNVDISALVLVFPPQADEDSYQIICRFWIPEEAMIERAKRDRVPYPVWVRQGFIKATPGNVIDYDFILAEIDELAQAYDIVEIAFDRWGATKIQTDLMEKGGEDWLVQFGQGYVSMNPPMKDLERLILEHKLAHGNNPVLTWMANNLVVRQDPAGNIKPDKEKSIEKIDGMVALVMGLDRATRHEGPKKSVYESRGLETA
jgi:phage terminase large subunit-like protein